MKMYIKKLNESVAGFTWAVVTEENYYKKIIGVRSYEQARNLFNIFKRNPKVLRWAVHDKVLEREIKC